MGCSIVVSTTVSIIDIRKLAAIQKSKKHNVALQRVSAQLQKLSMAEIQKFKNFINRILSVLSRLGRVSYI